MKKDNIFISSVQKEFIEERKMLFDYINNDPLLSKFFNPFIFENLPAIDKKVDEIYLDEVRKSQIYIGLFGKEYGFKTPSGISPTEIEYNEACKYSLTKLIFISSHSENEREEKENFLIQKAQGVVIRKIFNNIDDLRTSVYAALVRYLEEKEIIVSKPFDASFSENAILDDLDKEKVYQFIRIAKSKRGFPLNETDSIEKILVHLNLIQYNKITNAAILLFSYYPQRFFINSEIRCAFFLGNIIEKPITSYKVFKGTVFELVDQSVEYVLSKLDYSIETRSIDIQIPGNYEIPKDVLSEAIVNAIAHRDYTSNGSVQIMIFRDRIEIWNPGKLPLGWTTEKLKENHPSIPNNPLIAEPMYLAGYIERLGTGTSDMISKSKAVGLKEPTFIQSEEFSTIIYRRNHITQQVTPQDTPQDTPQVTPQIKLLIQTINGVNNREELQNLLGLKDRENFRKLYIQTSTTFVTWNATVL
jgi:ATP-dependent DNA helicase RecG